MDLQVHNSHLAAALMSGPNPMSLYTNPIEKVTTPAPVEEMDSTCNEPKQPSTEESIEEDKDEILSSEELDDEEEGEGQLGNKSTQGRSVTLQMLMEEKMLVPGNGAMTIEYLGQKFVGDLLADGRIKSHETETIFCSPSAWAIHCKRIINPKKRSGCGWASVKYKGKKLDTIKGTYLCKKQLQREFANSDEDNEIETESAQEPPPQRTVMKHNTVPNRMMQHDANMLIEAVSFASAGKVQPFLVSISTNACLVLDLHCHLKNEEVYGYLAGTWDLNTHTITISHTFPCLISKKDTRPPVYIELEIQMEIEKLGLSLLGWYHSHPTNPAMPSLRDCDNQLEYQIKMRGPSEISYTPCVGIICSPYNPESPVLESSLTCFWVLPPSEQRPTEYPRPLLIQYTMAHETHLSQHAMDQIKKSIKYYQNVGDDAFIKFKNNYKPDISYLDKLKCTLTPKFPREQSDGLLWHFIKDELGCSSEGDDKIDLDALLAVPQPLPVSKPAATTASGIPSVSTLQQMVSRPVGVPPINVSSGLSSSPHKYDNSQINIPNPTSTNKSSKSNASTYPSGLDMLTSMALGLGTSNLPLSLGGSGLDALAANSLLSGLPGMNASLASSLAGGKLADPPSYTASLQNLSSNISHYDKISSSKSSSSSSPNPSIPASLASNLMMSSADIANALFSAGKYSSSGLLGIPDPMSKSTLAANNMFLSPSLLKMQESLMKPLSSSNSISSKAGLDQNMLMKSPHDLLKSANEYLPPDFMSSYKGKPETVVSDSASRHLDAYSASKPDSHKYDGLGSVGSDSMGPHSSESFLSQMLELTKKTTAPDYASDYSQVPIKLTKSDDATPLASSSHSYASSSGMTDTITQSSVSSMPTTDEGAEQDYSMPHNFSKERSD